MWSRDATGANGENGALVVVYIVLPQINFMHHDVENMFLKM
jgi:hypothetical protein